MSDLIEGTRNVVDQLTRYGGQVYSKEVLEILEDVTDVNDDLINGRSGGCIKEKINNVRESLDKLEKMLID